MIRTRDDTVTPIRKSHGPLLLCDYESKWQNTPTMDKKKKKSVVVDREGS